MLSVNRLPAIIVVLGVAIGTSQSADATFEPGCSFIGGQCMYNVKLGHAGQCDHIQTRSSSSSPSSSDCCNDLSSKYTRLTDDLDKLKVQVGVMTTMISDSSKNMSTLEAELQKALTARDDILSVLNRKESELNSTKDELANIMANAAKEIQELRTNLNALQRSYTTCQTALGGGSGSGTTGTQAGLQPTTDYSLTYYNFNTQPKDFTFPQATYGTMQLLSRGSSTSTGPKVEHSWGVTTGHYLGIDAHAIAVRSSYARSTTVSGESGTFQPANAYCIMFRYYMEGADVKTLTANVKINGGTGYPIFTKSGPVSSHKWELAQVELDSEYTQYPFQIDFTMSTDAYHSYSSGRTTYKNTFGDIAIDDLYVYNTTCTAIPRHPKTESFFSSVTNVTSFYTFHLTPMTWTEAYDVCRREGPWTALVSVETADEHSALVNMIKSNAAYSIVGAKGFYTSGNDADSEHKFVWTSSGVPQTITLDNWHLGQPNNVAGNQDCLLMEYPNDNFKWGDVDCQTKHPFICEVEVPGKVTSSK